MKFDLVSVWKNVSHRDSLGSEAKPVEAIELSDEELAGVVGTWGRQNHKHHKHHKHHHKQQQKRYWQYGQNWQYGQYGHHSSCNGYQFGGG